jgi:hypothetical protein
MQSFCSLISTLKSFLSMFNLQNICQSLRSLVLQLQNTKDPSQNSCWYLKPLSLVSRIQSKLEFHCGMQIQFNLKNQNSLTFCLLTSQTLQPSVKQNSIPNKDTLCQAIVCTVQIVINSEVESCSWLEAQSDTTKSYFLVYLI